jgi:hypothetical protein
MVNTAAGCVDKCRMTVVNQTQSDCAQTGPCMTHMTSHTSILLVYFVYNIASGA